MRPVTLVLPYPPPSNKLWEPFIQRLRSGKMFPSLKKSKRYREWIVEAGWVLNRQKGEMPPEPITYPVSIDITVGKAGFDLDAPVKATFDALQRAGVIENDNLVHRFTCAWDTSGDVVGVQCDIMAIGEA